MKKAIIILFFSVAGLLSLLFIPLQHALVFEYENTGQLVAYLKMDKGSTFQIKYTHSIHLSDVIETYEVTNTAQLKQKQLEYEDFAIGMPADAEGNEKFVKKNGHYVITNMNRTFDYIDLRVGQVVANHTLIHERRKIPFSSFMKEGTWVRIDYRLVSLWDVLKGVNVLGQR
jgi:hypothetical protein